MPSSRVISPARTLLEMSSSASLTTRPGKKSPHGW
jgi:hypothetical protein